MRKRKRLRLSLIVLSVVLVSSCQLGRPTPIVKILENPAAFQEVTVSGVVTERISVLGWNAYVLRDQTGEIKVLTNRVLPRVGDRVRVSGEVKNVVALGDFQVIVLAETERKRSFLATEVIRPSAEVLHRTPVRFSLQSRSPEYEAPMAVASR